MSNAELKLVKSSDLFDHPRNPRVIMREEVIDGIAANMGSEYEKQHALHVRPVEGGYEIISGHHRKRAADQAGLIDVWCWVEDLDDEAAYMALATSNNQGELSPLEIGMHALHCETLSVGGRGKKGGLRAYAERIGQKQPNVSMYRQAAAVSESVKLYLEISLYLDKAKHLAAIHKLPEECWQAACEWLAESESSVADVRERVSVALEFSCDSSVVAFDVYTESACALEAFRQGKDISKQVQQICDVIVRAKEGLDIDLREQLHNWFIEEPRFDIRAAQDKRIEIESIQWERDNAEAEESQPLVSVLLADPPWRYDFAETDSRQIENQYPTAEADEIARHLELPWAPNLADDCVLFMWATAPKLREAFTVIDGWGFKYKTHAIWDKGKIGMGYWFRGQHELLLVATRGQFSPPGPQNRFPSVFREDRDSKHSKKPACVYEAIEKMFPEDVKFEMYAREQREGWFAGGNES